jgi:hypothetical protein
LNDIIVVDAINRALSWGAAISVEVPSMASQSITLNLPEKLYQRIRHAADTMQRPLEDVLFQTIQGNLPPALDNLPDELQAEFAQLQIVDDQTLWKLAKAPLNSKQWQHHQELLDKNQSDDLSAGEQTELANLRKMVDKFVMRRSYALALLKWRGYSLPQLQEAQT